MQEVYSRIVTGEEGEFSLTIIRSSGKRKGERVYLDRCRYGAPAQAEHTPKTRQGGNKPAPGTVVGGHLLNGTLPLTDLADRNRYKSPKISHIVGFQGMKVIH